MTVEGQKKRVYRWYATPWEILRQLPELARISQRRCDQGDLEREARRETEMAARAENANRHARALYSTYPEANSVSKERPKRNESYGFAPLGIGSELEERMRPREHRGCGNDGLWTAEENQSRFPSASHSPWKSLGAIPTFPQPTTKPVEKWKTKRRLSHFPTGSFPLQTKDQNKKGGLAAGRFAPASRLILQ